MSFPVHVLCGASDERSEKSLNRHLASELFRDFSSLRSSK
jgi:hypothetical protein